MKTTYYWHIHHDVIADPTENIEEREAFVRAYKPANQVETRLRLMIPVIDQDSVDKARKEYVAIVGKARKEYEAIVGKAHKEYEAIGHKAWKEYEAIWYTAYKEYDAIADKTWKEYNAKLWGLHKKEHPDCPWDGKTIFPEKRTD